MKIVQAMTANHQAISVPPTHHRPISPMFSLPNELFLEIFSYFHAGNPAHVCQLLLLRRVSRTFDALVTSYLHGKLTFYTTPMGLSGLQRMIAYTESDTERYKACFGRLVIRLNYPFDSNSSHSSNSDTGFLLPDFQHLSTVTEKAFAYFLVSIPFLECIGRYIKIFDIGGSSHSALTTVRPNAVSLDRFYRATAMVLFTASSSGVNYLQHVRTLHLTIHSVTFMQYFTGCFVDPHTSSIINTYHHNPSEFFNYAARYPCSRIPSYFTITNDQFTLWREATGYDKRCSTIPPMQLLTQIQELRIFDPRMADGPKTPHDVMMFAAYVVKFRKEKLRMLGVTQPEDTVDGLGSDGWMFWEGDIVVNDRSEEYQMGDVDIPHPNAPWLNASTDDSD